MIYSFFGAILGVLLATLPYPEMYKYIANFENRRNKQKEIDSLKVLASSMKDGKVRATFMKYLEGRKMSDQELKEAKDQLIQVLLIENGKESV